MILLFSPKQCRCSDYRFLVSHRAKVFPRLKDNCCHQKVSREDMLYMIQRSFDNSVQQKESTLLVTFLAKCCRHWSCQLLWHCPLLEHFRTCMYICKTWRQRVLQSVHLHYNSFGKLTQGDMHLMVTYAPYLHKIRMGSPRLSPVDFFASTQFTCLQSLILDCKWYIHVDENTNADMLY